MMAIKRKCKASTWYRRYRAQLSWDGLYHVQHRLVWQLSWETLAKVEELDKAELIAMVHRNAQGCPEHTHTL